MSQAVESLSSYIQAVEQAASPQALMDAVTALAALQSPDAISPLLAVLGYNNPGAAVVAMSGLITLGYVAVPFLLRGLDDYNYGARSYAIRALAAIGHPDALPVLQQAAIHDFAPSVRRAATKGLGQIAWPLLAPDQGLQAQTEVVATLEQLSRDADWAVRYAVVVAATALMPHLGESSLQARLEHLLQSLAHQDTDAAVRARILLYRQSCPGVASLVSSVAAVV